MKWLWIGGAALAIAVMATVVTVMKARTPTASSVSSASSASSGAPTLATTRVTDKAEPKAQIDLALVVLSEEKLPAAADVVGAFPTFAASGQTLVARPTKADAADAVAEFELSPCGDVYVALMPVPVPNNEADEMVQYSASALGTGWQLPPQKAHLIVTLRSRVPAPPRATSLSCLTSLLAAVVRSSPAIGVYWGEARATHNPAFFMSTAQSPTLVPRISLWSGVSVAKDGNDKVSLLSLGMKQLDLPDLLVIAPKGKSQGAMPAMFDILARFVERGSAFPDGETITYGEGQHVRVGYVRSPIEATKDVARVELK